jgi:hypothetical protein
MYSTESFTLFTIDAHCFATLCTTAANVFYVHVYTLYMYYQIWIVKAGDNGGWPEQEGTLCNEAVNEKCSNVTPVKPYTAPLYEVRSRNDVYSCT